MKRIMMMMRNPQHQRGCEMSPIQAIASSFKLVELKKTRIGNSKLNVDKLMGYLPIETLAVVPDNKRYRVTEKIA
jgi:hypothetical protein